MSSGIHEMSSNYSLVRTPIGAAQFRRWTARKLRLLFTLESHMNHHRFPLFLLALAVLALGACASGSAIVTGNTRPPVALEQVKIYLEAPTAFEVIGLVNASSDAGWTEQGSVDYAIEELKK